MNYQIFAEKSSKVAVFAAAELERYLLLIDPTLTCGENGILLTLCIKNESANVDTIEIAVENGKGFIAGANEGALLIAVYRFLFELGCRFTHPGKGGDHVPQKALTPQDLNVSLLETPSRRHRGVCIEGSVSEENVLEMIDFLPKVGMNSYFFQFFHPACFFRRWYEHHANPLLAHEKMSDEAIADIHARLSLETAKRGLRHHAVGHGWTCAPFGAPAGGWEVYRDEELPEEFLRVCAEVNGVRASWKGVPLNTNLCYSNAAVRTKIARAVVDYALANPEADVVHLWLADGSNNQCECPACRDTLPSDFYVMLLNEVDERLSAAGLDTKIVFLMYVDLLWAPQREALKNPDRFIAMFAPITRTYSHTLREGAEGGTEGKTVPYVRNKLVFPRAVNDNIAYLKEWGKQIKDNTFLFDYHLMWDHLHDPGYMQISRTLFADMQDLDVIGMDGMISCQTSRVSFPTGLPLYGMAKALWNKNADFDATADEFFAAEFGEAAADVRAYLTELSRLFDPIYLRGEKPPVDPDAAPRYESIPAFIEAFCTAHPQMRTDSENEAWRTLAYHAESCILLARCLAARVRGEDCTAPAEALRAYIWEIEPALQHRLDGFIYCEHFITHRLLKDIKSVT